MHQRYPCGLFFCQFQVSRHISSRDRTACQPRIFRALSALAQNSGRSPARRGPNSYFTATPLLRTARSFTRTVNKFLTPPPKSRYPAAPFSHPRPPVPGPEQCGNGRPKDVSPMLSRKSPKKACLLRHKSRLPDFPIRNILKRLLTPHQCLELHFPRNLNQLYFERFTILPRWTPRQIRLTSSLNSFFVSTGIFHSASCMRISCPVE